MVSIFLNLVNRLLKHLGFILLRNYALDDASAIFLAQVDYRREKSKYLAEGIVFSKDRPTQLHALLSSYFEKARNPVPLHVFYKATGSMHQGAYEQVFNLFSDRIPSITSSELFRDNLIRIIENIKADKLFFLVDDIVFIEDIDFNDYAKFDTRFFVPSLRLGSNLDFSCAIRKKQPLPQFVEQVIQDSDKLCWRWKDGVYDWNYPLSVDGNLFSTSEILTIAKRINYKAPNSFEVSMQRFKPVYSLRYGVCYRKSKIVNIPCNKVQNEVRNRHGNLDPDFLLEKWNEGLQIDYKSLYGFVNKSVHEELPIKFIKRKGSSFDY